MGVTSRGEVVLAGRNGSFWHSDEPGRQEPVSVGLLYRKKRRGIGAVAVHVHTMQLASRDGTLSYARVDTSHGEASYCLRGARGRRCAALRFV